MKYLLLLLILFTAVVCGVSASGPPDDYRLPPSSTDLIYNGTYSHWFFNMTHPQSGNSGHPVFEVYAIAGGLMGPILAVWGYWVFLVVWFVYLMTTWIRTNDIALPLIIGIISVGTWAMLFPPASYLYIGVMFAVMLASVLFKAFTDR